MYKILVIAGEPSGDNLGSKLIKEMKRQFHLTLDLNNLDGNELVFQGIGGSSMKNEGLISLYSIEDLSIMGISEVIFSLRRIYFIINRLTKYVSAWKPDLIITIDSPDFNMRLVKKIRNIDKYVPIIHYVAPSVWAWRSKRAKSMSLYYDKVLAILPFEKNYFENYGLSCDFVGHPIFSKCLPANETKLKLYQFLKIDKSKKIITVLPGSRTSEVKYMMPIFANFIISMNKQFDDIVFVIPTPRNVDYKVNEILKKYNLNLKVLNESDLSITEFNSLKFALFQASLIAVNTSGSVSLELARIGTPMISVYKCSWIFEIILKNFVKLKSANLVNIILKKNVIPEFLFKECNSFNIEKAVKKLINNRSDQDEQLESFAQIKKFFLIEEKYQSEKAAKIILKFLNDEIFRI